LISLPVVNLWKKRSLVFYFALMDIKIRFKGTKLGILWTALEPTLTFILLYIVFTTIRDRPQENFGIYLLTGIIIYHIFIRGTMGGLASLRSNRAIIESQNIPREFFPVSSTLATAILMIVQLTVFFSLMPFFEFIPGLTIVFLPIVLLLLIILVLGITYILSIINVYIRDIFPIWGIIVHALFFVTPIIWYISEIDKRGMGEILLTIHQLNPIGQIVELAHNLVVFQKIPPINDWIYATVFSFGVLFFGFWLFKKYEKRVVEEL